VRNHLDEQSFAVELSMSKYSLPQALARVCLLFQACDTVEEIRREMLDEIIKYYRSEGQKTIMAVVAETDFYCSIK